MKVNIQFDHTPRCNICEVSRDLFVGHESIKDTVYAAVEIPSYDKALPLRVTVNCIRNDTLPFETIKVSAKLFDVSASGPTVSVCNFEVLEGKPSVLESVTILLRDQLYSRLMQLRKPRHRLDFLEKRYGLQHCRTVVNDGFLLEPYWCAVSHCFPSREGVVDFYETQFVFVKDKNHRLGDPIPSERLDESFMLGAASQATLKLAALKYPVSLELISPSPSLKDDDSIYAFADFRTLLALGVTSGSHINISNKVTSRMVRIFVLVHPHRFESFTIYSTPRLLASFQGDFNVTISKCTVNEIQLPTASSVSIARVGSWNQCQKIYQNIILTKLKLFFTTKRRILHVGDMIPISFDTTLATLYSEDLDSGLSDSTFLDSSLLNQKEDALVWFYVEGVKLNDDSHLDAEFVIEPSKTKLVTANIIDKAPLKLSKCDFISYFDLDPVFHYDLTKFPYAQKLTDLLETSLKCKDKRIKISTTVLLRSTAPNCGKSSLVQSIALNLGFHLLAIDCLTLSVNAGSQDSTAKTIGYLRGKIEGVLTNTRPAIVYLSHLDVLIMAKDPNQNPESLRASRAMDLEIAKLITDIASNFEDTVFICSVSDPDSLPTNVRNHMKFELDVPVPDEPQRNAFFEWFLSPSLLNRGLGGNIPRYAVSTDVSLPRLSQHSAGLTPLDIRVIVETAKFQCAKRHKSNDNVLFSPSDYMIISNDDLNFSISKARDDFSASIGAPKIPNVTWDDIGGMDLVKGEIMDTIDMPLKHPELFASGMKKRSGVLFYGPPGTGKTLMAKAIATNFSLNFFSVKGPELLNMYIGESEANVRRVFQKARDAKPCVIFFDELDSVAPKRGNQGDSGGVMDRIVSQLLAELDGMGSSGDGVFVIGATNRPDLLDEALLRPGRFDKLLYLGISDTNEKQCNILQALTRKFDLDDEVDLMAIADKCPFNYTGADFYALCSDAMLNAMTRTAGEIDQKLVEYNESHSDSLTLKHWFDKIATPRDVKVKVAMTDFLKAQRELTPSVSDEELSHYLKVRANFESSN
ncbi:hypothetical protein HG536_0E00290 [Torulaspora globosa]|uniref:Peroxisomal ATPase PEX6 n=1 Tax=Torulaspora globosa TaxID=48254 RepID=A0A7G3ZHY3_9SACH|nr:uncharacterized protein HG536_0E00290 [Torulaspora globosa]QLL33119.1 hypothetical protein HG536_0E00290 [Torulaspora globosa]